MYAVIATGGKQYRVAVGDEVFVEKLSAEDGDTVKFDKVLALSDENDSLSIGSPYLDGAVVDGEVVKQGKQKKITVYKMKPKKGYRRKAGHRQPYTRVRITKIHA